MIEKIKKFAEFISEGRKENRAVSLLYEINTVYGQNTNPEEFSVENEELKCEDLRKNVKVREELVKAGKYTMKAHLRGSLITISSDVIFTVTGTLEGESETPTKGEVFVMLENLTLENLIIRENDEVLENSSEVEKYAKELVKKSAEGQYDSLGKKMYDLTQK